MKISQVSSSIALCLAPAMLWAHPGHFDGAPFAHSFAHSLPYLLASIAAILIAKQQLQRVTRFISARRRQRR